MDETLAAKLKPLRERIDALDAQILDLLSQRARAALDVGSLSTWIERFVDTAGYWHGRIAAANAGGPLLDSESAGAQAPRSFTPGGLPGMGMA